MRLLSVVIALRASSDIRAFALDDIPQVARLHGRVWPNPDCTTETYHDYFRRVYLENPEADPALPSLVSTDDRGRIHAFIGVVPRTLLFNGRAYRAAVSSQFIVDPDGAAAFAAVRILRAYFDGPQDLSIADEATDAARRLWSGLGATTAHLLSMYWTRPLRPMRSAVSFLRERPRWLPMARILAPCAVAADGLIARVPGTPFHHRATALSIEAATAAVLAATDVDRSSPQVLRVRHDERSWQWLLDRTMEVSVHQPLTGLVTRGGRARGWYVAALDRAGHCDVVHLSSDSSSHGVVLDQLFHHAWQAGAIDVTGRMDPRFMDALSDRSCFFHRRGPSMLVKTACSELQRAFESGNAGFARIDGEWALRLSSRPRGVPG